MTDVDLIISDISKIAAGIAANPENSELDSETVANKAKDIYIDIIDAVNYEESKDKKWTFKGDS